MKKILLNVLNYGGVMFVTSAIGMLLWNYVFCKTVNLPAITYQQSLCFYMIGMIFYIGYDAYSGFYDIIMKD